MQLQPKTIWSWFWQGMWRGAGTSTGVWTVEEERLGKWKAFAGWGKGPGDKGHRKGWGSAFFALVFSSEIYFQECSVLETVRVSGARATCLQWRKIRLRNLKDMQIRQTQTSGSCWDGSHPHKCSGSWPVPLQGHCLWEVMATGKGSWKQMPLQ